MSRSMSPTMVAEYKRILIPQEKNATTIKGVLPVLLKRR